MVSSKSATGNNANGKAGKSGTFSILGGWGTWWGLRWWRWVCIWGGLV